MATNQLFIDICKYEAETKQTDILDSKELKEGANTVGRNLDRDVVIPIKEPGSSEVSGAHTVIMCDGELVQGNQKDPGETNLTLNDGFNGIPSSFGTYVNGLRITHTRWVPLYLGDCISLGKRGYRLELTSPDMTLRVPRPEIQVSGNVITVRGSEIIDLPDRLIRCLQAFWDARGDLLSYDSLYEAAVIAPLNGHVDPINYSHKLLGELRARLRVRHPGFLFQNVTGQGYIMRKPDLD